MCSEWIYYAQDLVLGQIFILPVWDILCFFNFILAVKFVK